MPSGPAIGIDVTSVSLETWCTHELQWVVYERNTPPVWAQVVRHLRWYIGYLWVSEALQGDTVREALVVICDWSTMAPEDILHVGLEIGVGIRRTGPLPAGKTSHALRSMDGSYVFIVPGGVTAFAIIRDLLNAAQLRPRAVQPSLRCVTVSVTFFVTISPQTPHTQRNGMQPVLMAIPRSCRGFRRLCAEIDLPPNLTLVGLSSREQSGH